MARTPKITMQTSAAALAEASAPKPAAEDGVIMDTRGRTIRVKRLNALARVDFADIVGPSRASNAEVAGPAALAFSVVEIDGEKVFRPNSWEKLRALINRLDDEGINAAAEAHIAAGWVKLPEAGEGEDAEGEG